MTRVERIRKEKAERKKRIRKFIKRTILVFTATLLTCALLAGFLLYGPYPRIRELWVTTAMTTFSHQYLATVFFSEEEINKIMEKNKISQPTENTKPREIQVEKPKPDEKQKKKSIEVVKIKGATYRGYLMIVDDPSRVVIGTTSQMGKMGMKVDDIVKKYGAMAGINAGGFVDDEGKGWGGEPLGVLIENDRILQMQDGEVFHIVGFNKNNVLVLGTYTSDEIINLNLRDAISFKPFLVVNGEPMIKHGNGGWGIAPRTAIGQRKDGTVLMLAIDGRQLGSIGATLKDVQDIMLEYGAYNVANLDGGSSTTMVYKDRIINNPCSQYGPRYVPSAFIVK